MVPGTDDQRDKAVIDGLDATERFLDMLECLGCRGISVEALDDSAFVVYWQSPVEDGRTVPKPPRTSLFSC